MFLGKKIQQKTGAGSLPFEPNKRVCLFFPKKEGFPAAFGFGLLGRGPPGDFIKIFYVISFTFFAPEFDKGPVFPGFGPCGARSFTKNPAYSTDFLAFLCYNKVNPTTRQEPLLFLVCSIPAAGLCRRKTARPHRRPGFPVFHPGPMDPGRAGCPIQRQPHGTFFHGRAPGRGPCTSAHGAERKDLP